MSGPIDCADRINVMTAERALEPVRMMAELADLTAVSVRTLCEGRRFDVTVRKLSVAVRSRAADTGASDTGASGEHAYGWQLREVDGAGSAVSGGLALDHTAAGEPPDDDPENAYWSAVEALEGA